LTALRTIHKNASRDAGAPVKAQVHDRGIAGGQQREEE
jgi:hypothetical protein